MNLFSLLAKSSRRYADRGAIFLGDHQIYSFSELERSALQLATTLQSLGQPGDRILIASKNCAEYAEIMFAVWAAGMVIVPVNAKLHAREIAQVFEDAEPRHAFLSLGIARALADIAPELLGECTVIGSADYMAMFETAPAEPLAVEPDTLAWLFYTSGTTGRSKGAMLSHRNLEAMAIAHLADLDCADCGASLVHAAPMSHGSGLCLLPYISRGARQVIPESAGYDPAEFIALCRIHPKVSAFLAPTMVQRLRMEVEASGVRPTHLNLAIYGGGPMYVEELRRARAVMGPVFAQLYGQGEAPMTITGMRREDHDSDDDAVLGSVGWPRSGIEVAILDADGKALPAGEIGEIACRGAVVMQGYWNNPSAASETLRDGWLRTGDIGLMHADGRVTLHDRSKDVIISGGTNIYPREVEEALLRHAGVAEVAVVGVPDSQWGENIVAFIVARDRSGLTATDLDAHCLTLIARFKRPKFYHFVKALPKSSYGKVLKRDLLAALGAR